MYPTSGNTQLNFVCSHPESETLASSADAWDQSGSVDKLLEVYKSFEPAVLKLLSKAEPSSVKIWKLLDMKALPSWSTGRLALLGDAAHPFTPHQGQGAGVAMEDAASLSVVLPKGTKPEEVADRLKLYEQIRMERAHRIQHFSRLIGQDLDQWEKFDSEFLQCSSLTNTNLEQCTGSRTTISATTSSTIQRSACESGHGHRHRRCIGECQLLSGQCLDHDNRITASSGTALHPHLRQHRSSSRLPVLCFKTCSRQDEEAGDSRIQAL